MHSRRLQSSSKARLLSLQHMHVPQQSMHGGTEDGGRVAPLELTRLLLDISPPLCLLARRYPSLHRPYRIPLPTWACALALVPACLLLIGLVVVPWIVVSAVSSFFQRRIYIPHSTCGVFAWLALHTHGWMYAPAWLAKQYLDGCSGKLCMMRLEQAT